MLSMIRRSFSSTSFQFTAAKSGCRHHGNLLYLNRDKEAVCKFYSSDNLTRKNVPFISPLLSRSTVLSSESIRRMSTAEEPQVLFEEVDSKGVVTLNRSKVLNVLSIDMINLMYPVLKKWENEKNLVIVKGSGEKAFCAGGDVIYLSNEERIANRSSQDFFRREYTLDHLIGSYQIPYVAFITGIVMGGGCGISVHGQFRVASDKSLFAMPETIIGLFPDVGGSHFLPRLGGGLGMFLGLTGHRLKGHDLVSAGIATHFCPAHRLEELHSALLALPSHTKPEHVRALLDTFHEGSSDFSLAPHLRAIKECFTAPSLFQIIERLEKSEDELCRKQLAVLEQVCPTSVVITHELITRGAGLDLAQCLQMELRVGVRVLERPNFREGVRARLVDKDNKPRWQPPSLKELDVAETIETYFAPLPPEDELSLRSI